MAYDFLQADNRYFEADNQITSIGVPMTVSVRQRYPDTSAVRQPWGIYENSASADNQYFGQINIPGYFQIVVRTDDNAVTGTATPGADQWWNGLALFSSTTSRNAYVDTTASTTNPLSRSVTTEISIRIGRRALGNPFTGQLAEFAIWNAALNDSEINSLAKGFKPPRIRPQSLLYYVPLVRNVQEVRSGITFTASANAPTVYDHPRVY